MTSTNSWCGTVNDLCGHDAGERLAGRCDSFVVETDVHYPTDRNLLWYAARVMVRIAAELADEWNLTGWRQAKHLTATLRRLYQRVANTRRSEVWREDVDAFLAKCEELLAKAEATRASLLERGARPKELEELDRYITHTKRQIDQTDRRILQGEVIPQEEKVLSVFKEHMRWISKGKAGLPVELGVPVAIVEDQYQFILEHQILWQGATRMLRFPSSRPRGYASWNSSPAASTAAFTARNTRPPSATRWNSTPCPPRAACPTSAAHTRRSRTSHWHASSIPPSSRRSTISSSAAWTGCAPISG